MLSGPFDPFDKTGKFADKDEKSSRNDDSDRSVDWRELDRRKDRSQHRGDLDRSRSGASPASRQSEYEQQRYKKQLEELFKAKPSAEQEKYLKKIRAARGQQIDLSCRDFFTKFGLPKDWDSLLLFLDCSSADLLTPTLQGLEKMSPQESPTRQTVLKQRLRILTMTVADRELKKQAEAMLSRLP